MRGVTGLTTKFYFGRFRFIELYTEQIQNANRTSSTSTDLGPCTRMPVCGLPEVPFGFPTGLAEQVWPTTGWSALWTTYSSGSLFLDHGAGRQFLCLGVLQFNRRNRIQFFYPEETSNLFNSDLSLGVLQFDHSNRIQFFYPGRRPATSSTRRVLLPLIGLLHTTTCPMRLICLFGSMDGSHRSRFSRLSAFQSTNWLPLISVTEVRQSLQYSCPSFSRVALELSFLHLYQYKEFSLCSGTEILQLVSDVELEIQAVVWQEYSWAITGLFLFDDQPYNGIASRDHSPRGIARSHPSRDATFSSHRELYTSLNALTKGVNSSA